MTFSIEAGSGSLVRLDAPKTAFDIGTPSAGDSNLDCGTYEPGNSSIRNSLR